MEVVLAGAGHTHIEIIRQAEKFREMGHRLTIVSPLKHHPYSGMAPGMLGGTYSYDDILLPAYSLAEAGGAAFIQDAVAGINTRTSVIRLVHGGAISYDIASVNIGSDAAEDHVQGDHIFTVKPIERLFEAKTYISNLASSRSPFRVVVAGGGPAGVEVAGNVSHLITSLRNSGMPARGRVSLYASSSSSIGGYRGRAGAYILKTLKQMGVAVHQGERFTLSVHGKSDAADAVLLASGVRPAGVISTLGLPVGKTGSITVNKYLQVTGEQAVFAVGDCAEFSVGKKASLDRVGVYAVRQQQVLLHNLLMKVSGNSDQLIPFRKYGPYLSGLNLGGGIGLLQWKGFLLTGRKAFLIKDFIDRRFIRRYSVSEGLGGQDD